MNMLTCMKNISDKYLIIYSIYKLNKWFSGLQPECRKSLLQANFNKIILALLFGIIGQISRL